MTLSRAQVHSSSRSRVLIKLTADQVLVFDSIAGLCLVNLLKTEAGCSMAVQKPVNSNPGLKVNHYNCSFYTNVLCVQLLFCVSVL